MEEILIPPIDNDVVFVCGALRSGTTLLRLMIDGHPALSNPGEMDFLFEPPMKANGTPDIDRYKRDLENNRVFKAQNLIFREGLGYPELAHDFIAQLRTPGKRLTINVHRHFDRIPTVFPNARFIHLLRDPRDAAKSAIGMGWAGNVYHGVDHWINSERDFERLAAKISPGSILSLRNEDLIRNTVEELSRICAFSGVGYDPAMLSYPARSTYGPPDSKLVDQWRRNLAPSEIALIESKAATMMQARGYELSGGPAVAPGRLKRRILQLDNSLGRWRFAAERHGFLIASLDIVTTRLPIPGLEQFVRQRKAASTVRHLK